MKFSNKALLPTHLLIPGSNTIQANKYGSGGIAKFCACIIAVGLLLTAGSASSGVMDDIKADMTLNEAPLLGVSGQAGWHTRAIMSMGGAPRGDNTPQWWTPDNLAFKSSTPWDALTPWFVIHKGTAHAATNVRVKIYAMETYVLKKSTNKWELVSTGGSDPSWAAYFGATLTTTGRIGPAVSRVESDGKLSYKFTAESTAIHGGTDKRPINGSDVVAVFGRLKSQLILDDPSGVDDRHLAQLLVSVAGDYYPAMTTKVADYTPMTYAPNMAASRFGLVSATPRTHYVATIDPPGQINIGSDYQLSGGVSAIPVAQFEANPPPLIIDATAPFAPASLMASVKTSTTNLSWSASTDNVAVTGYKIYRNGAEIGTSTETSFSTFSNLVKGVSYNYTVRAYDAAGNLSASSSTATVTKK